MNCSDSTRTGVPYVVFEEFTQEFKSAEYEEREWKKRQERERKEERRVWREREKLGYR